MADRDGAADRASGDAGYGTARTFAQTLGYTHAAQLLQETLEEERAADEILSRLAAGYS